MALTFSGLDVVDDRTVVLRFVDEAGQAIAYEFVVSPNDVVPVITAEREFGSKYRAVPGPETDDGWPEKLVDAALRAYHAPLPSGDDLDRLWAEARAELSRRWDTRKEPTGD